MSFFHFLFIKLIMEANEIYREPDLTLVNARIIIALIIIGAVGLTVAISYNERLKLTGNRPFWSVEEVRAVAVILRIALLIAAIAAVYYCNIALKALRERDASLNDIGSGYLNLYASIFGVAVAALAIIAVLQSSLAEEDLIYTTTSA